MGEPDQDTKDRVEMTGAFLRGTDECLAPEARDCLVMDGA